MRRIITILALLLLFVRHVTFSQDNLKLVKATSNEISIKDGNGPMDKDWDHLAIRKIPVTYDLEKNKAGRKVTFYTDIDSIAFDVKNNNKYNFKVLLNSKDTCYVQLSTVIPSYYKNCNSCVITSDTIPFYLGKDNYIHIKGKVNNSEELDFIFDTGAGTVVLTERGLKKAQLILDGTSQNSGLGGISKEQTSSSNHLEINDLNWKDLSILYLNYKGSLNTDGVLGFNIFEDKIVEINYDKNIMIIHSKMPMYSNTFVMLKESKHNGHGTFIKATLNNGEKDFTEWFLFDLGNGSNIIVDGTFSTTNNLLGTMEKVGEGKATGTGGTMKIVNVLLPKLKIAETELNNFPISLLQEGNNDNGIAGILGVNVLIRFNIIIDYPNAAVYLQPNRLFNSSFFKKKVT